MTVTIRIPIVAQILSPCSGATRGRKLPRMERAPYSLDTPLRERNLRGVYPRSAARWD